MPIYEYEPDGHVCLMCDGRVAVLQGIHEEPLRYCPSCGLEVRRVVSGANFRLPKNVTPEKAAERGFTTWRRAEKGKWEKIAGPGVDMIVGSEQDMAQIEKEKKAARKRRSRQS